MSVQEYLDKHMLSRKIEDAVNAAVRAKATDPILFISNHMKKAVPSAITKIRARQILDSRGIPTVEVDLYTNKGMYRASSPSGTAIGMYEAVELRDGDKGKFLGKGVSKAVKLINERISETLIGMDPTLQAQIDQAMIDLDKTENKTELGANAMLAVSIAACKAGAAEKEVPLYKHIADLSGKSKPVLPVPAFTVISGGKHAGNSLAVQAVELRDGDKGKFLGKGVSKAVKLINERISETLIGMDPTLQAQIDQAMIDLDKTENKTELGANAMLAVSIAACKAGAAEKEVPLYKHIADLSGKSKPVLPVPAFTVISGGKHAGNSLAVQEIMILPVGANNFTEAVQMGSETYHHLKSIISEKYGSNGCNVGDDGGFAPNISSFSEGLDLVKEAIDRSGYNGRIKLAMDVAATDFCIGRKYDLDSKAQNKSGQNFKTGEEMIEMYTQLCSDYPIVSIEQPFDKDDWEHAKLFSALGICQVVGDDLLMSNPKRIERAIQESACNALLLKINQIGTITEAIEVVKQAKDALWGVVISHRSGETEDSFLADLAVGLATGQIKAGAPCRGERVAKYNQLLRVEEELGSQAVYAGEKWRLP